MTVNAMSWSVETLTTHHRIVSVDSSILIYLLDDSGRLGRLAGAIIDAIDGGGIKGVIASVGIMEALVGPARVGAGAAFERAADELRALNIDVVDLDRPIAEEAARLRGDRHMSLQDSIHVASAHAAHATAFVTNDQRIGSTARLEVFVLGRLELSEAAP